MLQEEIINIRIMQQSQTQEFTGECTGSATAQSAPPCMSEYKINYAVKGQRHCHTKRVGSQLRGMDKQAGPSSSIAAGSSTSANAPTPSQSTVIPEFVHRHVQGLITSYHQYFQSYMSSVIVRLSVVPHVADCATTAGISSRTT